MISQNIDLILLVSGLATMGAIALLFAPRQILKLLFDLDTSEPTTLFLARHWGLLVFLVGGLLVYSTYDHNLRDPVLLLACLEKLAIAGLIFLGPTTRTPASTFVAAGDLSFAMLYICYFIGL